MKVAFSKDYRFIGKYQDYFVLYRRKSGDIELVKSLKYVDSETGLSMISVDGEMVPTFHSYAHFDSSYLNMQKDSFNTRNLRSIGEVV